MIFSRQLGLRSCVRAFVRSWVRGFVDSWVRGSALERKNSSLGVSPRILTFSLNVVRPYGLTVHSNPKPDLTRKPKTVQKNR